jgi:outer membrane lipoprotein-sorting protein
MAALCFATLAAPLVAAQKKPAPVTIEEVVKKVQEQQKKTNTLQADFRQEKELALLAKPEVSTGTFVYSKLTACCGTTTLRSASRCSYRTERSRRTTRI